ncbi:XRE family transcriptional regulator [Leptospira interrogans]|uniref:XRE family transcriptional regulator n=1 Tax=Leptospira interrogans TaxID=173 RepID=UPI001EF04992|nr:XRE family transcriptional regulator [Leptospira interrogans]ULG86777.1 XRE family transcriptional regulator [Leptospira interrogans]UML83067.1 XRE family transcriptional regulator [Leptospira interrogans]UMQ60532.1 XRE family transcriptional regulator [Leptospira interrogans]
MPKDNPQKTILAIIKKWRDCLHTEESDRKMLTDYIRNFVESKRGNVALLSRESNIAVPVISNLINESKTPPSMGRILTLVETIQKLTKS